MQKLYVKMKKSNISIIFLVTFIIVRFFNINDIFTNIYLTYG